MWAVGGPSEARSSRIVWALLGVAMVGVLLVARALTPDSSGMGTHEQLGLPPCVFRLLTTFPCPGCGLTTSFAHMAHFDVAGAVRAHAIGVPLFLVTLAAVPFSLAGIVRGWQLGSVLRALRASEASIVGAGAFALAWAVRLAGVW